MRIVTAFGFFVFIPHVRKDFVNHSERLKVIDVKELYLSNNYINTNACQVQLMEESENHNRLEVNCEILQDLPVDIKVDVRVSRSANENGPWQSIAHYVSYVCDHNQSYDQYHKYWSNLLMQQTEEGKCVRKGKYETNDAGVFKFWDMLPKNETKGYYFKSTNALKTSEIIIAIYEYKYMSVEI